MTKPTENQPEAPYRRAFLNQYNMILLGGTCLFALTTFSWLPLLIGAGLEVLWITLGADTSLFKRWVATQEGRERKEMLKQQAMQALKVLDPGYIQRFNDLQEMGAEIEQLAGDNASLERVLIDDEMARLGQLLHAFLQLCVLHQRLAHYLAEDPEREIRRDLRECDEGLRRETHPEVLASLRQSQALAEKRLQQHQRIAGSHKALEVKLFTLEKSFRFLKSHILSMGKREELSDEIGALISGIESVEELSTETDRLLLSLGSRKAAAREAIKA